MNVPRQLKISECEYLKFFQFMNDRKGDKIIAIKPHKS